MRLARVCRRFKFDSAHHLPGYNGKCANVHGHSWKFEVEIQGYVGPDGMVIDFSVLKKVVQPLVDQLDHDDLNKYVENPTAENLAAYIFNFVEKSPLQLNVTRVSVWESEDSYASIRLGGAHAGQ